MMAVQERPTLIEAPSRFACPSCGIRVLLAGPPQAVHQQHFNLQAEHAYKEER